MSWSTRLWLTLFAAAGVGGAVLAGGFDARGHTGAFLLVSLLVGAAVVAFGEAFSRFTSPSPRDPIRTLATMLAVLLPLAVVASVILGSVTPVLLVVVFGGMAFPIVWRRRQ